MQTLQLKVAQIIPQTAEAISISFEKPQNFSYKAGQFITLLLTIDGEQVRRAYSLCSSPLLSELPTIAVKRVKAGKVSNYLNDTLRIGNTIEILPPMGVFTTEIQPEQKRHIVFLAGGSGITPILSLIKTILYAEPRTKVSLIYANRNWDSIMFREEITTWQQKYADRCAVYHVLEQAPNSTWQTPTGYLTTETLKHIFAQLPPTNIRDTEYFMCGPAPMMQMIEQSFKTLAIPLDKLRKENFALSPEESAKVSQNAQTIAQNIAQDFIVTIHYEGLVHKVAVKPTQTILEAALKQGIDLPYSCQSGLCTACMGKCTQGKVKLDEEDALTPKELAQGFVLTCVGHPLTPDVVIEID